MTISLLDGIGFIADIVRRAASRSMSGITASTCPRISSMSGSGSRTRFGGSIGSGSRNPVSKGKLINPLDEKESRFDEKFSFFLNDFTCQEWPEYSQLDRSHLVELGQVAYRYSTMDSSVDKVLKATVDESSDLSMDKSV